jgi:uncharacterized protein YjiS (DUF1127 family)
MLCASQLKDSIMTRPEHSAALRTTIPTPIGIGLMARLRSHFAHLQMARAGQARLTALSPETLRDTGLSPEDLTGAPSHDPALPFFMQAHFGRHLL